MNNDSHMLSSIQKFADVGARVCTGYRAGSATPIDKDSFSFVRRVVRDPAIPPLLRRRAIRQSDRSASNFSRAAESRSRHPDCCSPLSPARGHVAHNTLGACREKGRRSEASAAALRLSSSQSQAPAR